MSITPTLINVGFLFGNNFIFRVPRYQRYYAWDAEQISDFLNDLRQCQSARKAGLPRQHFFGGLVTVRANVEGSSRQNMEIIDGQQRVASFSMLAAQLRNCALKLSENVDTSSADCPREFLIDFAGKLKEKFERYPDKVMLTVTQIDRVELSKPDKQFFKELMDGRNPKTERQSHVLLKQAWDRIAECLTAIIAAEATDVEKATALSLIETVMDEDWMLIHMVTDTTAEAYRLFQVLNDRGTGLTEGELLRARLLEELDGIASAAELSLLEETWDKILSETPDKVEQQLRSIFSSMTGKRAGKTALLDDFLNQIFPEVVAAAPLTPATATTIVDRVRQISEEISILGKLQDGEWPFPSTNKVTLWDRSRLSLLINELKHTNCMPLLLAAKQLSEESFADIVQSLERFMFRYKIVCEAHIGAATNVYHSEAVAIRKAPASYKIVDLKNKLQALLDKSAKDVTFKSRLGGMGYSRELTNKPLKYFLITIESYQRWAQSGSKSEPKCLDKMLSIDPSATTIEHVYPEKANPADATLAPLLDTLGNLTLLGLTDNDAAGNHPFAFKKTIFEKSTVALNRDIASNSAWTEQVVKERQEKLENLALRIFRLTPLT